MNRPRCRSCGRPIFWARTTDGSLMPVDPDPAVHGNVAKTGQHSRTKAGTVVPVVRVVDSATPELPGIDRPERWVAHFATCPHADEWRRR